jgi:hypothetical protein
MCYEKIQVPLIGSRAGNRSLRLWFPGGCRAHPVCLLIARPTGHATRMLPKDPDDSPHLEACRLNRVVASKRRPKAASVEHRHINGQNPTGEAGICKKTKGRFRNSGKAVIYLKK